MWEWLKSWFRYKQVTSEELPHALVLEETLEQCYSAWMSDRELLNGARLELKTARKQIDELEDLLRSQDEDLRKMRNNSKQKDDPLLDSYLGAIKQGNLARKEMQERIDELENEVHNLTVELKRKSKYINAKQMKIDRLEKELDKTI
ncbi:hypothetical protein Riggi_54 [Bacillus phage Riggi]|uniref:Uncharacterized protein n=1 Tax=Bacillus phage Riggi TaxID=2884426 RepID=U5PWS6_9CAUD|nr:hypothetical protein Riggi_54 [Bacillus phage Riggi]AGY48216.1 hypothetical protein Riggi_54 [Bacillus phage Riggi]